MRTTGFQKWLQGLSLLTRRQREQLLAVLRPALDLERACATIEQARRDLPARIAAVGAGTDMAYTGACSVTAAALAGEPSTPSPTAGFANGCRVSGAWRRVTSQITWAGSGRWTVGVLDRRGNCSSQRWERSNIER